MQVLRQALIAAVVGSSGLIGGPILMVLPMPRSPSMLAALQRYLMQIGGRAMSMFIWRVTGLALALVVMGWGLASLVGDGVTIFGLPCGSC